jgi:hypothetical protein
MATLHVDPSLVAFLPDAQSQVMAATHDSIYVIYVIYVIDRLLAIRAYNHRPCALRQGQRLSAPDRLSAARRAKTHRRRRLVAS